ncbi:odorant receptor 67a-like [Leguminivora glycinivorella]|uniref:odorant receptor 67a-like n=1 Tax=Leguminivora glycinivorella TaxID=1035111 RepID=UPI00200DA7F4|nr:odorant receptor 67a-like [Leguminivora glycinivorella]
MIETLDKFGLAHCDLPTMMWNVAVMLRVVAVKIEGGAKSISVFFYLFATVNIVLYFFNYYASMLVFVLVGCRESGDMLAGIMVISISMNSLIGINKLFYIYTHQDKVQSLVADYIAYDRVTAWPGTTALMAALMRNVKTRLILFWAVTMGNAFIFNLQPLVMPSRLNLYDKHVVYGLKFILNITNYPFAVANIVACTFFICYITSSIGGLLIVTCGYSEVRLLTLSQEMRDLWSDAHKHYSENFEGDSHDKHAAKELNNYINYRLQAIVKSHAINIDIVKKLEGLFRNAIAVEFILLTAGLIVDLLGGLGDTYIILPFSIMQVSMDCYLGQKLMDASKVFENAIYDCKWENFDVKNRKTVLLTLMMSQRILSLSAGGVATLSFECLMAMYKAVYSAYTALRSTME